MMWPFKRKSPLAELVEAEEHVKKSTARAKKDLALSTASAEESQRIATVLRAHNEANHYDTLLEALLHGRQS
jgi:hypothetical protein